MLNRKRDTDVQTRLLDSVGEGEGGMFQENSIKTCLLSRVKQITSPDWMHETSTRTWCTGKTQRERVEREVAGGIGMGNTCKPMAVSFQCMTKFTTNKKKKRLEKVTFHSNPKEGQCQKMFKLLHNCADFTCQQGHGQNTSSQASTVSELRTSRCTSWIYKRQRNQGSNCQHPLDHRESKRIQEKLLLH